MPGDAGNGLISMESAASHSSTARPTLARAYDRH